MGNLYRFESYLLDQRKRALSQDGSSVPLTPKAFDVLLFLVQNPNRLITKEELISAVWAGSFVEDGNLTQNIFLLRKALAQKSEDSGFILTIPRKGYQFAADVTEELENTEKAAVRTPAFRTSTVSATQIPVEGKQRNQNESPEILPKKTNRLWLGMSAVIAIACLIATAVSLLTPAPLPRFTASVQITHDGLPKANMHIDGSRIYFAQWSDGRAVLAQSSIAGGETYLLPTAYHKAVPLDISPDHSQLLINSYVGTQLEGVLWSQPLPAGPPRRLGDAEGHDAVWSPDGRELLFARGSTYYVAAADGTSPRVFLSLRGMPYSARFSPDGSRIRFTLFNPDTRNGTLWEVNRNGSDLHPLLPQLRDPPAQCCGIWSPDGRYYFFLGGERPVAGGNFLQNDWPVNGTNIFVLREPTGPLKTLRSNPPVQLTSGPLSYVDVLPAVGGKQVYSVAVQQRGELVRYDGKTQQFVPFLSSASISELDFSRDHQWITYVTMPGRTLLRSRADGTDQLQLTSAPVAAGIPRWSPDGTKIAYIAQNSSGHFKIFLVSANGGTSEELLSENVDELDPVWSPDGSRLLFGGLAESIRPLGSSISSIRIFEFKTRRVSEVPGSSGLFSPRSSPDGRYIAAVTADSKKMVLYDFDSARWSDWITDSIALGYPSWSADSRYLYFASDGESGLGADASGPRRFSSGDHTYRRVMLGETKSELVVRLDKLHQLTNRWGTWSGITPDGVPLFLRDISTQEIYALDLQLQ
jgi:DNA-binding winged helix-turn-helix (wHTH) protein/Tol biopolymer transport system component